MNLNLNKNTPGKIFFVISVLIFIAMIFSPLNYLIIHKDEFFTMAVIKFPISDLIQITINDVHPPLYYLILKVITKILTSLHISYNTLFVFKLTSIVPYGLILLFSALKLEKEYGWLTVGIFTLTLACLSEFFMHFIIARMYSFSLLFLLISFYYYRNILNTSDRKSWILFTIFSVLAAYTHYFAAISAFALYLMLLIFILKNKDIRKVEFKKFALSVIAAVLLYSPWIISLASQVTRVHKHFWIPDLTLGDFIKCLCYFATSNKFIGIEIMAILSLIFFIAVLLKQYKTFDNNENFWILSGIGAYIITLLIGTILSVLYKPILIPRYLIPASCLLWFSISILIGKIENKKLLIVSIALIILLCMSGIADVANSNDYLYKRGTNYNHVLNNVNNDADIIIMNSGMGIMEFSDYLNKADIYTIEFGGVYGVENKNVHEVFNFTELNSTELNNLINSNSDKNVYLLDAEGFEKLDQFNKTKKGDIGGNNIFYLLN